MICTKCQVEKPETAFYKNKTRKSGLSAWCRTCHKNYEVSYKAKRKELYNINYNTGDIFFWRAKLNGFGISRLAKAFKEKYEKSPYCYYCKVSLTPLETSIDHKIPLSRNGSNDLSNLEIACQSCNYLKHARTETEFRIFLIEYIARFIGNEAEGATHRERLSEPTPEMGDAIVCSHRK